MTYEELKQKQVGGKHYKFAIQPWDFYRGWMTHEEWVGYLKGNIIDYLVRKKNGIEDLKKAQHLLDVLVATEEETENVKTTLEASDAEYEKWLDDLSKQEEMTDETLCSK